MTAHKACRRGTAVHEKDRLRAGSPLFRHGVRPLLTAVLCVAGAWNVSAQSLLAENFDAARPGGANGAGIPGTGFSTVLGNTDIIGTILNGAPAAYKVCPASGTGPNNCLDLNGLVPGAVTSNARFDLTAGVTYTLAFSAAGSVPAVAGTPYAFTVALGGSGPTLFTVPAGGSFIAERFTYTPAVNEAAAALVLTSATDLPGPSRQYGPLIDSLALSDNSVKPAAFVPLRETFNATPPGSNFSTRLAGSGFSVVSGNVDVLGHLLNGADTGFFTCPASGGTDPAADPGNCIDLNGDMPGAIESTNPFRLISGATYAVSFRLAGGDGGGMGCAYVAGASLGGSGETLFCAPANSGFLNESFLYTPVTDEAEAALRFVSRATPGDLIYGPYIDDITVTQVPAPGALLWFLTALATLGGVRRWR